jgi:hypothetical protein
MKLRFIVHEVEARLFGLGRAMIQADRASEVLEEIDLLQAEQASCQADLDRARARRDEVAGQRDAHQSVEAQMPAEIASSTRRGKAAQALRQALELERIRRELAELQGEHARLDHTVWCLEFRQRQLVRKIEALRDEVARI